MCKKHELYRMFDKNVRGVLTTADDVCILEVTC